MRRREFIAGLGGAASWPLVARAEQTTMPVIGFLSTMPSAENPTQAAFRRGLAEEGYVEGKNLAIEKRFTNFRPELMKEAAGDLVRLEVNVIFAAHPEAVAAAQERNEQYSYRCGRHGERSRCDEIHQEPCTPRRQFDRGVS